MFSSQLGNLTVCKPFPFLDLEVLQSVLGCSQMGGLHFVECNVQVRQTVSGWPEGCLPLDVSLRILKECHFAV